MDKHLNINLIVNGEKIHTLKSMSIHTPIPPVAVYRIVIIDIGDLFLAYPI